MLESQTKKLLILAQARGAELPGDVVREIARALAALVNKFPNHHVLSRIGGLRPVCPKCRSSDEWF